ncbi:hypothetical protein G5I_10137 [Acromyrmex echinatior]|uniref:Uncharacterized protein n=1 Tax=Acromyrmex echinatior TaxID=103372 RepID=F4WVY4_ACREC|nr:hypothetical protein G5I_10137 [Acromyrmex echinatior]
MVQQTVSFCENYLVTVIVNVNELIQPRLCTGVNSGQQLHSEREREKERESDSAIVDPPIGILPAALPHESDKYPPFAFYTLLQRMSPRLSGAIHANEMRALAKKMKFRDDVSCGMNRSPQRDGQRKGTSMPLYPST